MFQALIQVSDILNDTKKATFFGVFGMHLPTDRHLFTVICESINSKDADCMTVNCLLSEDLYWFKCVAITKAHVVYLKMTQNTLG